VTRYAELPSDRLLRRNPCIGAKPELRGIGDIRVVELLARLPVGQPTLAATDENTVYADYLVLSYVSHLTALQSFSSPAQDDAQAHAINTNMSTEKPLPFIYQFAAGAVAGVSEILVMYPLDVVKTRV
jgi:hypothetical protein